MARRARPHRSRWRRCNAAVEGRGDRRPRSSSSADADSRDAIVAHSAEHQRRSAHPRRVERRSVEHARLDRRRVEDQAPAVRGRGGGCASRRVRRSSGRGGQIAQKTNSSRRSPGAALAMTGRWTTDPRRAAPRSSCRVARCSTAKLRAARRGPTRIQRRVHSSASARSPRRARAQSAPAARCTSVGGVGVTSDRASSKRPS